MPKGIYIRTEEIKKKMSEAKKGVKRSEEVKKKISESLRGRKCSEETKRKMSKSHEGKKHSEKSKKKISEGHKGIKFSEEHKRKLSESLKGKYVGEKSYMYGKHPSEEILRKRSESHKGFKHSEETKRKLSEMNKGRKHSEETKKKISESHKGIKFSEEHKEKIIKAIIKANCIKPNKAELKLDQLLNNLLPNEYKFVGDGQVIIAGKCPDFININGKKELIELYGRYWHRNDDPQERIDLFKQFGYNTLVIWDNELKNEKELKNKILIFNKT